MSDIRRLADSNRTSPGVQAPAQTATYEYLFDVLVGAGEHGRRNGEAAIAGLATTVILFEPSVGLPLQLMALIHVEKASMTGACGLWGIETR